MSWRIALHGGAKSIEPGQEQANRDGLMQAIAAGVAVLEGGGAALDAVEAAVRVLEDVPAFNAGLGSVRTADGTIEMDAAIMDGASLEIGAVAAIRDVLHPVSVARRMLARRPTLLVGRGAERFAAEIGAEPLPENAPAGWAAADAAHDTVGCVAFDGGGNLAVATSTGGLEGTPAGRVGDTPIPGCGFYADNTLGATCFSGEGEAISRSLLAARVMGGLPHALPEEALEAAMRALDRVGGEAGGLVLDRQGRFAWAHNSSHFAVGMAAAREPARTWLKRSEWDG